MVYPQLRAVWCTVSFYQINFNGRRAVMKFAKYYIGSCIKYNLFKLPKTFTNHTTWGPQLQLFVRIQLLVLMTVIELE